jgi:hypothetical protein
VQSGRCGHASAGLRRLKPTKIRIANPSHQTIHYIESHLL